MDSHNDLYDCGTTLTHHFARVMLLDFSHHSLPEICYWTSPSVMHSISLRLYMNAFQIFHILMQVHKSSTYSSSSSYITLVIVIYITLVIIIYITLDKHHHSHHRNDIVIVIFIITKI